MDLHWLKPLLGRPSPFTTVFLDVTRAEVAGEAEAADRWKSLRRSLERDGAPAAVLDEIGELIAVPTGGRGPHGRVIIADAEGVRVDRVLSDPPAQSVGVHGPLPALLPAIRSADEAVTALLVVTDRTGADLTLRSLGAAAEGASETEAVEGGHDDVHKTREGGLDRRSQTRAEDSWQRNAEAVAAEVDRRVREKALDLVLLTGDTRAVGFVRDALGQEARALLVEVAGGGRGEGVNAAAFEAKVAEAVTKFRATRRKAVLDRFATAQGRGENAVTSLDDVVEVLRRGQVAELVLHVDALSGALGERELFVGPGPLELATSAEDLAAIGVEGEGSRYTADIALVRAALGQEAGVTFAEDGAVDLVDGVGALLRWSDGSTPSEAVPTQSGDQARLRTVV
ncbi:baeRF2 domain-containing protein [Cellulomonas rhizosphaerae]|uniref:Peptide chain release factor 1 n=1 Tax=Cellulomonas rhizosphaerae TaxID=2293719 RepID=A0A413RJS4_9CELL|nr:hypothetical protein [Cellulomonas rhizosphaerae]RHA38989.1 hypothetical protein D1825_12630 [Cellulomonas rhizosphaerae]